MNVDEIPNDEEGVGGNFLKFYFSQWLETGVANFYIKSEKEQNTSGESIDRSIKFALAYSRGGSRGGG